MMQRLTKPIRECSPLCLSPDSGWGRVSRGSARIAAAKNDVVFGLRRQGVYVRPLPAPPHEAAPQTALALHGVGSEEQHCRFVLLIGNEAAAVVVTCIVDAPAHRVAIERMQYESRNLPCRILRPPLDLEKQSVDRLVEPLNGPGSIRIDHRGNSNDAVTHNRVHGTRMLWPPGSRCAEAAFHVGRDDVSLGTALPIGCDRRVESRAQHPGRLEANFRNPVPRAKCPALAELGTRWCHSPARPQEQDEAPPRSPNGGLPLSRGQCCSPLPPPVKFKT